MCRDFGRAILPGIRFCPVVGGLPAVLSPTQEEACFWVLFCQKGSVRLTTASGIPLSLGLRQVLLLANGARLREVDAGPWEGMAVALEPAGARDSLQRIAQALGGLRMDLPAVTQRLAPLDGCGVLAGSPWAEGFFAALEGLPEESRACYCVLKTVELLYLAGQGSAVLDAPDGEHYHDRYQREAAQKVYRYIEENVGGDLTILTLAKRFRMSPTVLKKSFRQMYGRTLHEQVTECRMESAARLLAETPLTVLQVAERVGYSSTSHFSAAFRKRFYLSPAQFRLKNKKV